MLANRNAVGDVSLAFDQHYLAGLLRVAFQHRAEIEFRHDVLKPVAEHFIGRLVDQALHQRIDGDDLLFGVHGEHRFVQVAQHAVQLLITLRFQALHAGDLDRVFDRLFHRCGGVDEDARNACAFCQVDYQAGADDNLESGIGQRTEALADIVYCRVSALRYLDTQHFLDLLDLGDRLPEDDDPHPLGVAPRLEQGEQNIVASELNRHHRQRQRGAQNRRVGAGTDDHVRAAVAL